MDNDYSYHTGHPVKIGDSFGIGDLLESLIPLAENGTLTHLDLTDNRVQSEETLNSLISLVEKATNLRTLKIQHIV